MKKFAVVLSGCGVYDGAEIHEAVTAMLAISRRGHSYQVFAPNIPQHHVINHLTGEEMPETRNVMVEAARIARGDVKDLTSFDPSQYDALIFAGGFGAAKNLSDFAFVGENYVVNEGVANTIKAMHSAGKPIGAMCIAPILIADVIKGAKLTLGATGGASEIAEKRGAIHEEKNADSVALDGKNKIVTTPCYMLDATLAQVAKGADHLVDALILMM